MFTSRSGPCRRAVTYRGERKVMTPEEISAAVLGKMRDIASARLGEEVKQARCCFTFSAVADSKRGGCSATHLRWPVWAPPAACQHSARPCPCVSLSSCPVLFSKPRRPSSLCRLTFQMPSARPPRSVLLILLTRLSEFVAVLPCLAHANERLRMRVLHASVACVLIQLRCQTQTQTPGPTSPGRGHDRGH